MRFRSRLRRLAGFTLFGIVATALLSACAENSPNILNPKGPVAAKESGIAWFIFILAAVIFVIVITALIYNIVRFRARPGGPEATQLAGNTKIEIAWTVIPSLVLFAVLFVTIATLLGLAQPSTPNTLTVKVIGHQWWWEFQYPDQHIVSADEIHVPLNTVVHLDLNSDNVIHSLWIPQLTGKTDVIPGHNNTMWFQADVAGTYRGECTEFCGTQHAHMDFVVVAQSQADYNAWVAQQQTNALPPAAGSQEAAGLTVFKNAGCGACHVINGVNPPTGVHIGPNLTHFGSRQLIAGGVLDNTPANLALWVHNAQGVKNGADMPSFDGSQASSGYQALTPTQVADLVAYLESLK